MTLLQVILNMTLKIIHAFVYESCNKFEARINIRKRLSLLIGIYQPTTLEHLIMMFIFQMIFPMRFLNYFIIITHDYGMQ